MDRSQLYLLRSLSRDLTLTDKFHTSLLKSTKNLFHGCLWLYFFSSSSLPWPPLLSSFFCAASARGLCLILVYTRSSCCYTLCLFLLSLSQAHRHKHCVFSFFRRSHTVVSGYVNEEKRKRKKNFQKVTWKYWKIYFVRVGFCFVFF